MCYNSAIGSRKSTENKIIREIFETLRYYGIDEKMIEENRTKDLRNSITGLYRITLHQALIKEYNQKLKVIIFILVGINELIRKIKYDYFLISKKILILNSIGFFLSINLFLPRMSKIQDISIT